MEGRKIKRNLNEELTQVVINERKKKKGKKGGCIVKLERFDAVCRNVRRGK